MPAFEWGKDSTPERAAPAAAFEWGKDSSPDEPDAPAHKEASILGSLGARGKELLSAMTERGDAIKAEQRRTSPPLWKPVVNKDSPDWLAGAGAVVHAMPGPGQDLTPPETGERLSRFSDEHPWASAGLNIVGSGALPSPATARAANPNGLAGKVMGFLKGQEQKYATKMTDAATRSAEKTLQSATGTLGALTREGSSTLRDLAEGLRPGSALPTAEQAANRAVLSIPEAERLATDLAGKSRDKLPEMLGRIEGGRGLVQQAGADLAQARTPDAVNEYARRTIAARSKEQLKRYALPVAGATLGSVTGAIGGEEAGGHGVLGGLGGGISGLAGGGYAGRALSPTFNAVVKNNLLSPERMHLVLPKIVSTGEKLVKLAQSQPKALGKFAAPLLHAASRSPDAVAAAHYVLSADPEYQKLAHDAAESGQ